MEFQTTSHLWSDEDHEFDSGFSECSDESRSISPLPKVDAYFWLHYGPFSDLVPPKSVAKLIKWSIPPPPVQPQLLPGWRTMPYHLEQFWQSAFAWFFYDFLEHSGHLWTLTPTDVPPFETEWMWHQVSYSAKVRFQCQVRHGWTSMKGRVVFWYRIRRENHQIICESLFKLFGQECRRCNQLDQEYLMPLWYHEEIENAVRYFAMQVAEKYYGGGRAERPQRLRQGRPLNRHDPVRCQACREGICIAVAPTC